jgi:transposase-like protein
MAKYTREEREKIIKSRLPGESHEQMSRRTGVSTVTLSKWMQQGIASEHVKISRLHVGYEPETLPMIRVHKDGVVLELPLDVDTRWLRLLLGW